MLQWSASELDRRGPHPRCIRYVPWLEGGRRHSSIYRTKNYVSLHRLHRGLGFALRLSVRSEFGNTTAVERARASTP